LAAAKPLLEQRLPEAPVDRQRLRSDSGGVMVSGVTPLLIWGSLAVSFVIGLAAVVRMAAPLTGEAADITGAIRLPRTVTATIVTLFSLAAVVFLGDLLRRMAARRREEDVDLPGPEPPRIPGWLRTLTQLLSLAYFVVVAYLLWRGAIPLVDIMALGGGGLTALGGTPAPALGTPPFLVTWTFAALALAAGVGALALALWVAFGERLALRREPVDPDPPAEPLTAAVEESVEDLRGEPDPCRAIVRCYARFERVAAASGVARAPWSTPMEFMREALGRLPLPRAAVPALTGLFELARFSHHPLGPPERDRALAALDEIRAAIEEGPGDARAR
jgi:hypothetical protein